MLNIKIFYVGHAKSPAGKFYNWDVNSDGLIDKEEVRLSSNTKEPSETLKGLESFCILLGKEIRC